MALNSNPTARQADLGFAFALIAVAAWSFLEAGSYPGSSGTYPRVLSILLALAAAGVVLRRMMQAETKEEPHLFLNASRFALGLGVLVAYIVAINLMGFILPSLIVGISLPLVLGYRNLPLASAVTLGTICFIVAVFFVILGRPLPPDVLNPVLEALR